MEGYYDMISGFRLEFKFAVIKFFQFYISIYFF